jgi:hypothetical protein
MIGTAVALDEPGENSCEVCALTGLLCAQSNTKHNAEQRPRTEIAADVAAILVMAGVGSRSKSGRIQAEFCRIVGDIAPC